MKNRFLSPDSLNGKFEVGAEVVLSADESHHLARVARLTEGEEIELIDGRGGVAGAKIVEANHKRTKVKVIRVDEITAVSKLILAFGIPKANASEFLFHRCTELGVAGFQPLVTAHSLHPKEWNQERWERVVAETCKQCQEARFPTVLPPLKLEDWLHKRDKDSQLVYCYEEERAGAPKALAAKTTYLVIGPEGGWSAAEVALFRKHGGLSLGLGRNRLRAETASLVAATLTKKLLNEI